MLLKVVVHSAGVQDPAGGRLVGQAFQRDGPALPRLERVFVDSIYHGSFEAWAREQLGWTVEVVKRPTAATGFVVVPKRWVVERTFGWLGRQRRLSKDYEYAVESSEAFIYLAMAGLMARRLARLPTAAA